ncbi:MAG: ChbG/HpnK family deacetylase [Candidatus Moraniibacteriota bacterium]
MHITERAKARLILSADDYGIRDTVRRILPLAAAGKLHRVGVMVRYCSQGDATRLLATGVKIDIHLDLISLMGRGADPDHGTLRRGIHFVVRRFLGYIPASAVEAEWRRQIEHFRVLFGRLPDGLNSHEHVHFFPGFFRVFLALAQEYRIPYVRFGQRGMLLSLHHAAIGHVLHSLARTDHRRFTAAGLATSTYLVSLDWVHGKERFFRALDLLPTEVTVELVVHPEREAEFAFIDRHF